jgi:hypothetical protein
MKSAIRKKMDPTRHPGPDSNQQLGVPGDFQRQNSDQDSPSAPSLTAIRKDLPSDWKICAPADEAPFFKNVTTNTTSPGCPPLNEKASLPEDWEIRLKRNGTSYFYKPSERRTSEVHPSKWFETDRLEKDKKLEVRFTTDRQMYFADRERQTTTWEEPWITLLLDPTALAYNSSSKPGDGYDSKSGDFYYFFDFRVLYSSLGLLVRRALRLGESAATLQ